MRLFSWSNTLYACALQDPARILYLCNTASPLDAATSIPTHLSQRMSKTTTTCPVSWRGAFQIALAVAAFLMVDPYIRKLLSFVQEYCIAELSPYGFGAFVCLLVVCCFYILLGRYRNTYIPVQLRWGLLLVALAYLYYRYYGVSSCYDFWRISFCGWEISCVAWTDLLLLPIGVCLLLSYPKNGISVPIEEDNPEQIRVQAIQSDIAIEKEADDRLGFNDMVKVFFKDLSSLELRHESLTMGIIAEWGKGKSSFINLLINKIEAHGDIIIRFNPRGSKNVACIQEDFFDAFATGLSKHYMGFGFLLGRYTKHLGLLGQYEWTRPLESLLTLILPEKDVEAINEAISTFGKRIYVVIDDLDRLTGEEIIEVLKLVDRNASFSNVVFIIACDKEYVNNVLRKHLDHGLDHSFIDKYVTWEIMLPDHSGYLRMHLEAILEDNLRGGRKFVTEYWHQRQPDVDFIIQQLLSVRHLKRYVNLFISQYKVVQDDVDLMDFLLLSLLRYRYLAVYSRLCGGCKWCVLAGKSSNGDPFYLLDFNRVEADFTTYGLDSRAQEILCRLFYLYSDYMNANPRPDPRPNSIAWVYAFNRYFY